jgi:hypothetical protein
VKIVRHEPPAGSQAFPRPHALALCAAGITLAISLGACSIGTALSGRPGVDVSGIKPGAERAQVETAIGPPHREWQSAAGVTYCFYEFDGGVKPTVGGAALLLLVDVGTAGLMEVATHNATPDALVGAEKVRRIISYDAASIVLGVFAEDADLPADGRPRAGHGSAKDPAR